MIKWLSKRLYVLLRRLKDLNELVMFSHTIFSLPFILIAMVVAAKGWFGWRLLGLAILAAVSARNVAMLANRYLDRDIDARNPRTQNRPSVDGRFTPSQLRWLIGFNIFLFIGVAWAINKLAFWLSFPILVILVAYSYFKRFSQMAHLMLGVALGLAPIAGVVAVEEAIPLWSFYLALGVMFWVAGFDVLYALQDMAFDKEVGLYSIPSRLGSRCALFVSRLFHLLAVLFWGLFTIEAHLALLGWLALLFAAVMLWYEHRLVAKDFQKIDRAFFTVNGYLGVVYLVMIVLDRVG